MKVNFAVVIIACAAGAAGAANADSEASNVPHVATDDHGRCFAHSIPDERYGTAGRTDIYAVGVGHPPNEELARIHSYDWFAQQIYVACDVSDGKGTRAPAVAQVGPWPRGRRPDDETLAIAFHYNGETLTRYSTLDVAGGDPANASCSVSHYTVIADTGGFARSYGSGDTLFTLTTVDGRRLTFSATSGALLESEPGAPPEPRGACFVD